MKRILSLILALLMCVSLLPLGALADEEPEDLVVEEVLADEEPGSLPEEEVLTDEVPVDAAEETTAAEEIVAAEAALSQDPAEEPAPGEIEDPVEAEAEDTAAEPAAADEPVNEPAEEAAEAAEIAAAEPAQAISGTIEEVTADHIISKTGTDSEPTGTKTLIMPGETIGVIGYNSPYTAGNNGQIDGNSFRVWTLENWNENTSFLPRSTPGSLKPDGTTTVKFYDGGEEDGYSGDASATYINRYVNNTGLPFMILKFDTANAVNAWEALKKVNGTTVWQLEGRLWGGADVVFFENYYEFIYDDAALAELDFAPDAERPLQWEITPESRTYTFPDPVKRGYHFTGWDIQMGGAGANFGEQKRADGVTTWTFDFADLYKNAAPRIGDMTLTPKFSLGKTVTFDPKGGLINGRTSLTVEASAGTDTSFELASYVPVQAGYVFNGWSTKETAGKDEVITDTSKENYTRWMDGNDIVLYASWTRDVADGKITVEDQTYTGKPLTPAVTVEIDNSPLIPGTDYTVTGDVTVVDAGTYTVTVTGAGDYAGTVTKTFTVAKSKDSITAKDITKVYKAKAQSFSLKATTIGGPLTYKSNNKSITVSKTGKVTVKKGYVGKATITITSAATENCEKCVKKITVTVNPKGVKMSSVKNTAKSKVTAKWKKSASAKITGYQIQYSTKKDFSSEAKTVKVKGVKNVTKVISKLKKGQTYYVRVQTYQVVSKKTYYSAWSAAKAVKVKK